MNEWTTPTSITSLLLALAALIKALADLRTAFAPKTKRKKGEK